MSKALLKSSFVVAAMTMLSRIFGVIRDIVFSHYLGATGGADAFFIAFKIPNLMRRIFAEGAFSQAFIPVLADHKHQGDAELTRRFIADIWGTLGAILFVVSVVGVFVAPVIAFCFVPGWYFDKPDQYELTVLLLRFTTPYILFISLVACAGGILNSYGKFAVPAFTPVLLNLSLIFATLFIAPRFVNPQIGIACGVFIAGAAQLIFQVPFLLKLNVLAKPRWGWKTPAVKKVVKLMLPSIIGSSASQINLLVGSIMASTLVTGSVSWLYYSDRLMEFPVGVFGIAVSTVILPKLSQQHVGDNQEHFSRTLDWALRLVLIIGTPAVIGLIFLSEPIIATIFGHGVISAHDVTMASNSLIAYAVGTQGFILVKVLSPGFFARKDTKTPMRFGIISVVTNIVLSLILLYPLQHVGLALATSLAAIVNAGLLFITLYRRKIYVPDRGWMLMFVRVVLANIILGMFLFYFSSITNHWFEQPLLDKIIFLLEMVVGGGVLYFILLAIFGLRLEHLRADIH